MSASAARGQCGQPATYARYLDEPDRPDDYGWDVMIDLGTIPAFVALILVFLAPPGPDMAYMIAVGLEGGRRAAVRAILGIGTGMAVYAVVVAFGFGELARQHPAVRVWVAVLGSAYLLWLAFTTVRSARDRAAHEVSVPTGRWFLRGLTVSLTNAKLALFFLSVLPGFVGRAENLTLQMLLLGAVNVACEVVLYGAIGLLAGTLQGRFAGRTGAHVRMQYVAALVYVGLAVVILAEVLRG